jgi:hypothetical protein
MLSHPISTIKPVTMIILSFFPVLVTQMHIAPGIVMTMQRRM